MRVPCECGKVLKIADELQGKKVRCPACKTVLVAREAALENIAKEPDATSRPSKNRAGMEHIRASAASQTKAWREPGEEKETKPRLKKRGPNPSGAAGLWIGLGVGSLILAGGAVTVLLLWHTQGNPSQPTPMDQRTAQKIRENLPVRPQDPPKAEPVGKPDTKPPPPAVKLLVAPEELSQLSYVENLAFSQDGRYLATMQFFDSRATKGGAVYVFQVWDLATGKPLWKLHQGNQDSKQPIFSPDGKYVACLLNNRHEALVWDLKSGKRLHSFVLPNNDLHDDRLFCFSSNSQAILSNAHMGTTYRLGLADGKVEALPPIPIEAKDNVACSPTQPVLAVFVEDSLGIYDQRTGKPLTVVDGIGMPSSIAFSGDGKKLFLAYPFGVGFLETTNWTGAGSQEIKGKDVTAFVWMKASRDGKHLALWPYYDRRLGNRQPQPDPVITLMDLTAKTVRDVPIRAPYGSANFEFSADGKILAIAVLLGEFFFVDVQTGEKRPAEAIRSGQDRVP